MERVANNAWATRPVWDPECLTAGGRSLPPLPEVRRYAVSWEDGRLNLQAETILTGGPVLSPHNGWREAEAVAFAHGRIIAFGSRAEVMQAAGRGTRVIDLGGHTALPGLCDAHLHILWYSLGLERLQVMGLASLAEMCRAVGEAAAVRREGEWISGRGWDQDRWEERRLPTRHDLDAVSPYHPVYLQRNCNHICVVNTAALRAAGITRETPDPTGGLIDRNPETGEPTGILREAAQQLVVRAIPEIPHASKRPLLKRAIREALSYGITQVHTDDMRYGDGPEGCQDLFTALIGRERIPFRVTNMISIQFLDEVLAQDKGCFSGDQWYRLGQVKLFADGSLGGRTARLLEDYSDEPGNRGLWMYEPDEFKEIIRRVHTLGMQIGVHCIGDGAAQLMIDAVNEAQRTCYRADHRHRLIHAQILNPVLIQRMRANRIIGDIQPVFLKSDGYWYESRVGPERVRYSYAWKTLLDHGIALCGGSDCPIEPLNIAYGLYAAVTRQDLDGYPPGGWAPAERLTVAQALDLYTVGAAYSTFEENFRGSLRTGMAADVTVFDRNPFTVHPSELKNLKAVLTIVGGNVAFER
jgi:predicted amidohydrolase YtcJ